MDRNGLCRRRQNLDLRVTASRAREPVVNPVNTDAFIVTDVVKRRTSTTGLLARNCLRPRLIDPQRGASAKWALPSL